ncbi:hypothetical protein [Rhizobium leguminosarum]
MLQHFEFMHNFVLGTTSSPALHYSSWDAPQCRCYTLKIPSANSSIIIKRSLQKRGKSTEILNENEVLLSFSKLSHQDAIRIFARRLLRRKRFTAKIATCLTATRPVQAPPAPTGISRPKKLATTVGGAMTSASPQAYQVPAESVPDHRE